jgi:F-type H+-transporting ATPase subunit gamma
MPNLKDIRKRISSVKSTQQITKAMKMVAASYLRKATEAALEARPYADSMEELFQSLISRMEDLDDVPLVVGRDEVRTAAVVVLGSNRGLCGSFNTSLFRVVERFVWEERDRFNNLEQVQLWTYGKKSRDYFRHRNYDIARAEIGLGRADYFTASQSLGRDLMRRFKDGEIDRIDLAYNRFKSALNQTPTIVRLFPLGVPKAGRMKGSGKAADDDLDRLANYKFEPDQDFIFDSLLPKYLDTQIHQAFLESEAGEQGSRMTAMDSATRNAGEMIERLTLDYNRARQAAITTELVEIVSGAEAL